MSDRQVVVVTGGGSGLGEATCQVLATADRSVVVADIGLEKAERVARHITSTGGVAVAKYVDVANETSVRELIRDIQRETGRLDVVINNAGIDVTKPIFEMTVEEWDRVMGVNLRGPFLMSKIALEGMRSQKSGHIINILSTAALRAWTETAAYHASKWGLRGLTHALVAESRKYGWGVKITGLIAGGMKTPFILDRFPEAEPSLQEPRNVAEVIKFILSLPKENLIPEIMAIPMMETSWP